MQETLDKLEVTREKFENGAFFMKSCRSQLIEEETLKERGLNADRHSKILQ
jgi:hypothetical protein